jgi:hypothetical protein
MVNPRWVMVQPALGDALAADLPPTLRSLLITRTSSQKTPASAGASTAKESRPGESLEASRDVRSAMTAVHLPGTRLTFRGARVGGWPGAGA